MLDEQWQQSSEKHREKSHDGKLALTRSAAIQRIHYLGNLTGLWYSAYPCDFCDWWHVGSYEKIAQSLGLKPRVDTLLRNEVVVPIAQSIGAAMGEREKKLRELYPETPLSHWHDHLRGCAACAEAFSRGRRLCPKGALLYHNGLAYQVRRLVKEKRQGS